MGRFDGFLFCSDYDGTLYYNDTVLQRDIDAVEYFKSEGGLFTIVSGRSADFFADTPVIKLINTYIIGLNGALIYDPVNSMPLYEGGLPEGSFGLARRLFFENAKIREIRVHDRKSWVRLTRENIDTASIPTDQTKIVFIAADEDSERVRDYVREKVDERYCVERGWLNGIELLAAENTKGSAVRRLAGMLGKRAKTVICAGDYENDVTMMRAADIGFAVGNALDSVKEAADEVVVPANEGAIAFIVNKIGKNVDNFSKI